jgi:hypothetical protein
MSDFDRVVFYGRTLQEYEKMFMISCSDLRGKSVLDCPGGPSSFQTLSRQLLGIATISVDPMYINSVDELRTVGEADIEITLAKIAAAPEKYPLISDLESYRVNRQSALGAFLTDYALGKEEGRYLAASLPSLPFDDNSFDAVLSSYLLFAYAPVAVGGISSTDTFNLEWHIAAINELLRVVKVELRLYPAHTYGLETKPHPYAEAIMLKLTEEHGGRIQCSFYNAEYSGKRDTLELGLRIVKS